MAKSKACCSMSGNTAVLLVIAAVFISLAVGFMVAGVITQVRMGLGMASLALYFVGIILVMLGKGMKHQAHK